MSSKIALKTLEIGVDDRTRERYVRELGERRVEVVEDLVREGEAVIYRCPDCPGAPVHVGRLGRETADTAYSGDLPGPLGDRAREQLAPGEGARLVYRSREPREAPRDERPSRPVGVRLYDPERVREEPSAYVRVDERGNGTEVHARIVEPDGRRIAGANLFTIRRDGTLKLHRNVNVDAARRAGLRLDREGRVELGSD